MRLYCYVAKTKHLIAPLFSHMQNRFSHDDIKDSDKIANSKDCDQIALEQSNQNLYCLSSPVNREI